MQTTSYEIQGQTSQEMQAQKLLPAFLKQSKFQIHAHDDSKLSIKLQDADIPQILKSQLNEILNNEFTSIISKSSADFGRTNLVEMDLPNTGLPFTSKPYTIPLKYNSFMDDVIKLLEDAGSISKSLSNWASPICIIKKSLTMVNHISLNFKCVLTIEKLISLKLQLTIIIMVR